MRSVACRPPPCSGTSLADTAPPPGAAITLPRPGEDTLLELVEILHLERLALHELLAVAEPDALHRRLHAVEVQPAAGLLEVNAVVLAQHRRGRRPPFLVLALQRLQQGLVRRARTHAPPARGPPGPPGRSPGRWGGTAGRAAPRRPRPAGARPAGGWPAAAGSPRRGCRSASDSPAPAVTPRRRGPSPPAGAAA